MTSSINTSGLNTSYPVAGINNSTQGFRDNFNNIKQNLDTASNEITDLQSKVILKTALNGANLDNNMGGSVIKNAQTQGFRGTGVNLGTNVSGNVTIDVNVADVYYGTLSGASDVVLSFAKWAPAGTLSQVRTIFTSNTMSLAGNIILPASIDQSRLIVEGIGGANNLTIYPHDADISALDLLFSTVDCGTTITVTQLNRTGKARQVQTRALNPVGQIGDVVGTMVYSNNTLFIANANFDGTNQIFSAVGSNGGGVGLLSSIANGTANVVTFTNANVAISAGGSANRVVVSNIGVVSAGNLTVGGNISANAITANGNLQTFGTFTANQSANFFGNVTLFNTLLSTGTGNISAGNIALTGSGSITGNLAITANLTVSGISTVAGNLTGGNLLTGGFANITGNLTAANITANNAISGLTLTSTAGGNIQLATASRKVTIQPSSSGSFAANYTLTLPINDGEAGQLLSTDGSGVLSWINVGAGNVSNGSSGITIVQNANINFAVTGNAVANLSAIGLTVNGNISGNSLSATTITSNGTITVSGAGTSSITSTGGNIALNANVGRIAIVGNVNVSNASGNTQNGYLKAALIANTLPNGYAPTSNGSSGVTGTITFDSNYIYFCLGPTKWARLEANTTW